MKTINVGFPINLEKLIESRALVQANSGGGKSYLLRKLIEEAHGKVPFIVLDLEGEFISLREEYDVIIFGKGHDIPINIQYADKFARYLLELSASAIIDLSELKHHERILFVKRFLESMIDAPKHLWHPTLLILDEAHQFCPEDSRAESMQAVIDLCTRGRKRGYCAVLATQRLSKLHKDAAAELNNKMIGRTSLDVDVKRTALELGMSYNDAKQLLRKLDDGEFYVFGPAISQDITKQKVSKVHTTHAKSGMKFSKITPPSRAIQKLIGKISEIPAELEKEKDTVKVLQEEVVRLKALLKNTPKPVQAVDMSIVSDLKKELAFKQNQLNDSVLRFRSLGPKIEKIKKDTENGYETLLKLIEGGKITSPNRVNIIKPFEKIELSNIAPHPKLTQIHTSGGGNPEIPKCERAILTVLAQEEKAISKSKIAIRSGYSANSGGFNNALGKLRTLGYIEGRGDLKITDSGRNELGDYAPLPAPGEELCKYWLQTLPKCESMILAHLITFNPGTCSKEVIAEATGYSANSGGFNNALGKLRTLELIEGRGEIKASDSLFA